MRFAILGSGAVGGYFGAKLAREGHDVRFVARGAHLDAIRQHGLRIESPLGDFVVRAQAESDTAKVGPVDCVMVAVKTYSNAGALPLLPPLMGPATIVLTLQNGIESVDQVAAIVGQPHVLGGCTYVAAEIAAPGLIRQTGTHRRVIFGEVWGALDAVTPRVRALDEALRGADILSEVVPDARIPLWEKLCYLAPFAGFTGAARLPIGPLWADAETRALFLRAVEEVAAIARAEGVAIKAPAALRDHVASYIDGIPGSTRSSLLIDLSSNKPIEVEALQGAIVRRGRAAGLPTPIISAFYAVLKPHATPRGAR